MELCEAACRSPLLLGGGLRSRWIGRHSCRRMPMLNSLKAQWLKSLNCMPKSRVESTYKGGSATRTKGLCNVLWMVEVDIADDQLLYITGDPVALGCWDPEMAIPLYPSWEHSNLWMAEIRVPFGSHFKYNYIIKGKKNPSHILWRPGPEFSLSIPSRSKQCEKVVVRDLWLKTTIKDPADSLWNSWAVNADLSPQIPKTEWHYVSCGGDNKILQSEKDNLVKDTFTLDHVSNDETSEDVNINCIDPGKSFAERDQPVEEPWFFRSIFPSATDAFFINDLSNQAEVGKIELPGQEGQNSVKLVPINERKLVHVEESVSTVILINSSICTMQRIAILEDEKLVELLLEPVKNNVHCDSVYLGTVTKLVPHMGGAFVDIGISRPSLMDIKQNREPFAYPPFSSLNKGKQLNSTIKTEPKGHVDVNEDVDVVHDSSDGLLEPDIQDEFMHEYYKEREDDDTINVSDSHNMSVENEIIEHDDAEIELEADYEENVHDMESEDVEDAKEIDLSNLTLQDSKDRGGTHSKKNKWAHVRKGTKVIVQVVKEGLGTKGPALTAYPSLRSRFWILISRCNRIGVSKKITGVERTRLRVIAKTLQPPGFGLTVRTVAAGHSLEELQKDLEGLLSTWKGIVEHAKSGALAADEGVEGAVPVLLHQAMSQTLCVVQDYFNEKVKSMVVDSPRTYYEVTNYLQEIAPDLCNRVVLYNKGTPIFDDYGIEEEINNILTKRVPLSNGGSLVIEQTEALVSIDVNGGHSMLGQGTSQERAVLEVNLAAAKQIARELRLRDIGGIIVVDFIDMDDESNKRLVYEEVKRAVERDKSIAKVSELSRHGLMEITRKRVRPSVSFLVSEPCSCCHGTGRVEALETSFSKIEREICRLLATSDQAVNPENARSWPRFVLKVDRYMCNYLTSGKRTKLAILSSSLKVWILLKVARGFARGAFEVKPFLDDRANDEQPVTISRLQSAEARSYIPNSKLTFFPVKKWKTRG